ncbi:MAG TPA: cbb3-type cytochrome c oxidase subunit I, partial [Gammaproteobacteria bacterium]|nr:cbb3-type cytochrome c oxidase subunit I [Gammaproteobacteria bacterium]
GTLGWVSMITIGSLYVLVPKLFNQEAMYSQKLIFLHFWLSLIGTLLYTSSLWIAGVMQGLMWRALDPDGTLTYSFIDAVNATHWFYVLRLMGGLIFLTGMLVMTLNVWRTLSKPTLNPKTVPLDPI